MTRYLPWAGLLAVGFLTWLGVAAHLRGDGALRQQIQQQAEVVAALQAKAHATDTVYRRDTLTLTRWRDRYRTAHDTLRVSDTVWVKQFIAVADSTIKACSVALQTCEQRVAQRDSLIAATQDLLRLEKRRRPGFLSGLVTRVTWAAIGFGAASVIR